MKAILHQDITLKLYGDKGLHPNVNGNIDLYVPEIINRYTNFVI